MMLPIAVRSALEALRLATTHARVAEAGSPRYVDVIDAFPLELKLPARARSAATVASVCVHVTDVRGGFGVARSRVRHWRKLGPPPVLAAQGIEDPELVALLERYHRCAYHRIASRAFGGLIVRNHPPTLRTSHGNGGNRGLGFAVDAGHAEALSPRLIAVACEGLRDVTLEALACGGGPVTVAPHRAFAPGRRVDTDGGVWRGVVRPTADALGDAARIDYEHAEGGGRPIPRTWDDRALFDLRGRRV